MLGSLMEMIRSGAGWGVTQNHRALQGGIPVLVNLRPFEVLVDVTNSSAVNPIRLQTTVGTWMQDGFNDVIDRLGSDLFAPFEQIFLTFQQDTRRSLLRGVLEHAAEERELQQLYKAAYAGVSVWSTTEGATVPSEDLVASIQLQTILTADTVLLEYLQDPSLNSAGLGDAVQAVQAQISGNTGGGGGGGGGNDGLDIVVIIAIVVAVLAFLLLGATLFLAYRRNAKQKEAYKVGAPRPPPNTTATEEKESGSRKSKENGVKPPVSINGSNDYAVSDLGAPSILESEDQGGGLYPESLISEDISTSLTAYYRGGMASRNSSGPLGNPRDLNDAASISSMESYGYSLDGIQSTVATSRQDSFLNNGTEKAPEVEETEDKLDVPTRNFDEPSKDDVSK